tara:strand:- start:1694 stop:2509 length:816 start_codon:yes stop_codon:yes gene_type:complete
MSNKTEFTFEQASVYLEIDDFQLGAWVINNKIRVGLYAKNWVGYCVPNTNRMNDNALNELPIEVEGVLPNFQLEPQSKSIMSHDLNECEISRFWYISNDNASSIILNSTPSENEVTLFTPVNETELLELYPHSFPFPCFNVAVFENYQSLGIDKSDLVFQLEDLQQHKEEENQSIIHTIPTNNEEHYFNITDSPDEISIIIEVYFNRYIELNYGNSPSGNQLWIFMIQDESRKYFSYELSSKVLKFHAISGKKDTINLRSFIRRFKSYTDA